MTGNRFSLLRRKYFSVQNFCRVTELGAIFLLCLSLNVSMSENNVWTEVTNFVTHDENCGMLSQQICTEKQIGMWIHC